MIELEHSPLGGSAAHRFINCAGSFLLQRELLEAGQLENIESEFAEKGTGAHELGAVCLATDTEPFEYLGDEFNGYLAGWPEGIDLDAVAVYVNHCRSIMDLCDYDGLAVVEKTYKLPHIHPLLKGTVDFGYLSPSRGIFLRDYKNGEGIGVSAAGNRQLLYYAFLLIVACGLDKEESTTVSLGIVQPNFYGVFEEPDVWETTVGYVLNWATETLLPRMNALTEMVVQDADFISGEHCQFCPVLLECPTMQHAFLEYANASEDFVTMLTNEELDTYWAQRENARRFMKVLETTVHARLLTGGRVPSAKLVEKRVNRVWKPGGVAAIEAAFGPKAYKPQEPLSPAGVEKLSSRGKELALEYGYKPDSAGFSVAGVADPRPEAKPPGNAGTFANFAQSPQDMGF